MYKRLALFVLLAACMSVDEEWATIQYVIDGDTVIIENGTKKGEKIRLIGINAPEPRAYKHRQEEPFGKEASAFLKDLLKNQQVRLEFDVELEDQYGRTLAYLYLSDGRMVNQIMLEEGFAQMMTFPPNVKYTGRFVKAQQNAKYNSKGIWK